MTNDVTMHFPPPRSKECPFDPPAELLELQASEGLSRVRTWDGAPWLVTGYEACKEALLNKHLTVDPTVPGFSEKSPAHAASLGSEKNLRTIDDPEHAAHKRLLISEFTVRTVRSYEPMIQGLVDQLLDELAVSPGPVDLIEQFALPIPLLTICEVLGVPHTDAPIVSDAAKRMIGGATFDESMSATAALREYLRELIAMKTREPDDRLVSRVVRANEAGQVMGAEELVDTIELLVVAGHETTANQIGLTVLTLLMNPDALGEVRDADDPRIISNAMEEMLRYHSPSHLGRRRASLAEATIGGATIPGGEGVIVGTSVADRDPRQFADPHTLDIHRPNARKHLAFGYGVHQCLGQHLTRLELIVSVRSLLKRFPRIELAVPFEQIEFREDWTVYGVERLPVRW